MKKFLSRSIPVFLAVLILVGSLAVPAFAAENDTYTIIGKWRVKSYDVNAVPEGEFSFSVDLNWYLYGQYHKHVDGIEKNGSFKITCGGSPVDAVSRLVGDEFSVNNPFTLNAAEFELWSFCFERIDSVAILNEPNTDSIFSVFGDISGWIVSSIGSIMPMFYSEASGLTFVGTLAVAGLAFAVFFLIFAIIRRFMHFGG